MLFFTSLPKKKARSIGAPVVSGLTRPLLYLPPHRCHPFPRPTGHQPSKDQNLPPTDVPPPEHATPPHWCGSAWRWRQRRTLVFGAKSLVSWVVVRVQRDNVAMVDYPRVGALLKRWCIVVAWSADSIFPFWQQPQQNKATKEAKRGRCETNQSESYLSKPKKKTKMGTR